MGTGSHRPQWEAAKGREDARTGIAHARSLPSHTKLKYRRAAAPALGAALRNGTTPRADARRGRLIEHPATADTTPGLNSPSSVDAGRASGTNAAIAEPHEPTVSDESTAPGAGGQPPNSSASESDESDDDEDEAELRRELDLINKRRALLAQRDAKRAPAPAKRSAWRSEATFKSKPAPKSGSNLSNDVLQKAEHRDFLDKYLK